MLHELRIHNFAIIDDLQLRFGPGLNILTGETGAGKSIIIDAVSLLLGDRALAEWVRAGTDRAEIEATFFLPEDSEINESLRTTLEAEGLEDPDHPDWLILGREVRLNGRNIARVNGRSVSLQVLSELTAQLVDVHGQGEHLSLLQPKTHIFLLDRFGNLVPQRQKLAAVVTELRGVQSELRRLRQDARTLAQRVDLLRFQVDEIHAAALEAGEDAELESERRRLSNAEALLTLAQAAETILGDGDGETPSASDLVSEAVGRIERLARIDPDMTATATASQALLEQLADLARDLSDYAENLEFNPERLKEVEDRLELIAGLKRKYGDTLEQIITFGQEADAELESLGNWEVKTAELETQENELLHRIGTLGAALSAARASAGEAMARGVEQELAELRMDRARFGVAIDQREAADGAFLPDGRRVAFDRTGVDQVAFLISANPGEPLKPMAKVASGGETARLMLALKSVLTHADATPTLIFDEIDQGIGGRVGGVVGNKLWQLTGQGGQSEPGVAHQVLCITHLPQLAAYGDNHFTVNKEVVTVAGDERTRTRVDTLTDATRVDELMQMLGAVTDAGRQSVEEMMAEVAAAKRSSDKKTKMSA